jgi:hypothetical protein
VVVGPPSGTRDRGVPGSGRLEAGRHEPDEPGRVGPRPELPRLPVHEEPHAPVERHWRSGPAQDKDFDVCGFDGSWLNTRLTHMQTEGWRRWRWR